MHSLLMDIFVQEAGHLDESFEQARALAFPHLGGRANRLPEHHVVLNGVVSGQGSDPLVCQLGQTGFRPGSVLVWIHQDEGVIEMGQDHKSCHCSEIEVHLAGDARGFIPLRGQTDDLFDENLRLGVQGGRHLPKSTTPQHFVLPGGLRGGRSCGRVGDERCRMGCHRRVGTE